MRTLYPEIEPHHSFRLRVDAIHELHVEECGRADGVPVVFLHGGPGAGVSPYHRRFFDPARYRIVLFDQRGAGRSTPHADLRDNTTGHLVEDIERLREHLGFESWTVFGGSWGSTLAIAYAITHPERVDALVLRGVFLLTQRELKWFYQDGASMLFPDAWARFQAPIPEAERGDMISAYHKRLIHSDRRVQAEAAAAWSQWEGDTISIRGPEARPSKFNEAGFAIAFARIECHFFANGGFFEEDGWLLKNIHKIRGIPGWIVQGRFDVVTPLETAWALKSAWPECRFEIVWDAGHASTEPGIIDGLVRATDQALAVQAP